jgi:hypothetical protein
MLSILGSLRLEIGVGNELFYEQCIQIVVTTKSTAAFWLTSVLLVLRWWWGLAVEERIAARHQEGEF